MSHLATGYANPGRRASTMSLTRSRDNCRLLRNKIPAASCSQNDPEPVIWCGLRTAQEPSVRTLAGAGDSLCLSTSRGRASSDSTSLLYKAITPAQGSLLTLWRDGYAACLCYPGLYRTPCAATQLHATTRCADILIRDSP